MKVARRLRDYNEFQYRLDCQVDRRYESNALAGRIIFDDEQCRQIREVLQ